MLKKAILCVDDEAMILESLKEQLRRDLGSDYRIEVAESGEEALKILDELTQQEVEIPIIISDHLMPGMNGEELLSRVHSRFPETLKIFLTGRADADAVGNAVNSANLYRYIPKPWDAEDLRLTLTEGLRSYSQERTLKKQREELQDLYLQAQKEIAERKQAEQRFRDLLESAPNAMIISDQEGKIILVNAQAEKLFGYPREELLGMAIEALIPAMYPRQHRQHRQGYYADPRVRPMGATRDLQAVRQDGSTLPIEVSLGTIQTPEGMVVMATIFDISERKRAAQKLESQYQFEKLISDLSARFVNIPPDQVDREIERALQQILEYFQVDRCGLLRVLDKNGTHLTHACYAAGIPSVPDTIKYNEYYPWHAEKMLAGETVHLHVKDLPPEAAIDRQSFEQMGIRANLAIPLMVGGSVDYIVVINAVRSERLWTEEQISRVRLLGEIFVNALVRKRAEEELKKSYHEIKQLKDRLQVEADYLQAEIKVSHRYGDIVGDSTAIRAVLSRVEQVAPTDSLVLIHGETGTGKELIARAIHDLSPRKSRVMVKVNCASLPASLIESELFGREKGAYTGALTKQIGRFEVADGSTLFLDEVGELSIELQVKLLRVLQEGEFERLGSPKTIKVNVRVIAATNRDLTEAVRKGNFREDLYYRLNVFPIEMPPLRERSEDIPMLAWTFINEFNEKMGKKIQTVPKRTMEALRQYLWPGNIRELRNVIEHAVITSTGNVLQVQLPKEPQVVTATILTLEEVERQHIISILELTNWRIKGQRGAAELLGLKPSTLYAKMEKLGILTHREKDVIPT